MLQQKRVCVWEGITQIPNHNAMSTAKNGPDIMDNDDHGGIDPSSVLVWLFLSDTTTA